MKFGLCASIDNMQLAADSGFDYVELGVADTLKPMKEEYLTAVSRQSNITGLVPLCFNLFFPGGLNVVGPGVDMDLIHRYIDAACTRAVSVGAAVVGIGSGAQRRIPEGFAREEAQAQLLSIFIRAGTAASASNLKIAIEPLVQAETNVLNSVQEAYSMATQTGCDNVGILCDSYHLGYDVPGYPQMRAAGARVAHLHVASEHGRSAPMPADLDHLAKFLESARVATAVDTVSIECSWTNMAEESKISLDTLRRAWSMVGE